MYNMHELVKQKIKNNDKFYNFNPLKPFPKKHKINLIWLWDGCWTAEITRKLLMNEFAILSGKSIYNKYVFEDALLIKEDDFNEFKTKISDKENKLKKIEDNNDIELFCKEVEEPYFDSFLRVREILCILYGMDIVIGEKTKITQLQIIQEVQCMFFMHIFYKINPSEYIKQVCAKGGIAKGKNHAYNVKKVCDKVKELYKENNNISIEEIKEWFMEKKLGYFDDLGERKRTSIIKQELYNLQNSSIARY